MFLLPGAACLLNPETNNNHLRISYSMLNEKRYDNWIREIT